MLCIAKCFSMHFCQRATSKWWKKKYTNLRETLQILSNFHCEYRREKEEVEKSHCESVSLFVDQSYGYMAGGYMMMLLCEPHNSFSVCKQCDILPRIFLLWEICHEFPMLTTNNKLWVQANNTILSKSCTQSRCKSSNAWNFKVSHHKKRFFWCDSQYFKWLSTINHKHTANLVCSDEKNNFFKILTNGTWNEAPFESFIRFKMMV